MYIQRKGTDEDGGGTIDVNNDDFDDDSAFVWSAQAKIDWDNFHAVSFFTILHIFIYTVFHNLHLSIFLYLFIYLYISIYILYIKENRYTGM